MGTNFSGIFTSAYQAVSIQLVSLASGDSLGNWSRLNSCVVSIQLVSPASGDVSILSATVSSIVCTVSIQLVSPASGDGNSK